MFLQWFVRPNTYHDSVKLMRVSEMLTSHPGVVRAAAVMATPLNLELLASDGLLPADVRATPEDFLVTVLAETEAAASEALSRVDAFLAARPVAGPAEPAPPVRRLERGVQMGKGNLAVIAVPGRYAAAEAYAALRAGLHVFLFSDHVSLEDEVRLKQLAAERDLLMMGPDCGTAILNGVGLGFANRVERGPVGIVGASGTGIQQVCCLLDEAGIGIAQAIGTGGRDLSVAVGGSMTRRALWTLEEDDSVEVIALISKPADRAVTHQLHQELSLLSKSAVVCLLGETPEDAGTVRYVRTLSDVASTIAEMLGAKRRVRRTRARSMTRAGGRVYGLFAGGTLCAEAAQVLDSMGVAHRLVDLGADEHTRGRAHPIIDPRLRASMLAGLADHEDVGAILLDVILGDLAHSDPAGALVPAIEQGRQSPAGVQLPAIAALVGTRGDPQGFEQQEAALRAAGVQVFTSNAQAAMVAGKQVKEAR